MFTGIWIMFTVILCPLLSWLYPLMVTCMIYVFGQVKVVGPGNLILRGPALYATPHTFATSPVTVFSKMSRSISLNRGGCCKETVIYVQTPPLRDSRERHKGPNSIGRKGKQSFVILLYIFRYQARFFFFHQNIEHFSYFITLKAASPENLISRYGYFVGHASSCSLRETEEIVWHTHTFMIKLFIDVNGHRPWLPVCCVIMQYAHSLPLCRGLSPSCADSHSHLTGDLGLYCYS